MAALKIPYSRVECRGNELKYIGEVLDSGWLTTAAKAFELEDRVKRWVGAKHACAVNSGTAALHLGLEALGVKPGDRVFVPTMTFTASAEIIRYLGADPVFLDVEYGSALLTPGIVERAIAAHPDVRTLVVVHYGGQAARMTSPSGTGILDLCRRNGLRVLEDAAHAFPSRLDGRFVGSFGDATGFSFYANKTITTGEGGMLVTDDAGLASRARVMRLHGIDRDIWNRYSSEKPSWEYDVVAPGFKYNMPDINAAVGLAQLEQAEEMRRERERCARFYMSALSDIGCLDLPKLHVGFADHAWHLFAVVLTPDAPISRNRFIEILAERGIGTSVHYKPLHRMTYYQGRYGLRPEDFPDAERVWKGCVSLPIYPSLSDEDLGHICAAVHDILA